MEATAVARAAEPERRPGGDREKRVPAIVARALARAYGPGKGVEDIDLEIPEGECFGILGRNGSGKSTLTRLLSGTEAADSGSLAVFGVPARLRGSPAMKRRSCAVFDRSVFWENLSGRENAYFFARSYGMEDGEIQERLAFFFDLAGMDERASDKVAEYSFGMRRKLGIIEALAVDPDLLILDEPSIGLDAAFKLSLTAQIRERTERGKTTWISGNDPEFLEGTASRVGFMEKGRLAACAGVGELLRDLRKTQTVLVEAEVPTRVDRPALPGLRAFEQDGDTISAVIDGDPFGVPRLMDALVRQGFPIRTIEVRRGNLRDAFLLRTLARTLARLLARTPAVMPASGRDTEGARHGVPR